MSYETGVPSGGALSDLMLKLKTFLTTTVTSTWTLNDDNFSSGNLSLSKDDCHIHFKDYGAGSYTDYYGNSITDERLSFHLSSSYSGAGATPADRYITQPDSLVTSQSDRHNCIVNDLGDILNYWFFASDAAPYYCHVVLETRSSHFQHFCFGNVDKKGASYTGGAYAFAQYLTWWHTQFDSAAELHRTVLNNDRDTVYDHYNYPIFAHSEGEYTTQSNCNLYVGDLSPTKVMLSTPEDILFAWHSDTSNYDPHISRSRTYVSMQEITFLKRSIYSGEGALHPIIAGYRRSDVTTKMACIGEYADVRLCNMEGVSDGQEITIGSDVWKFFPIRKTSDVVLAPIPPSGTISNNSHWLGIAYKKIV